MVENGNKTANPNKKTEKKTEKMNHAPAQPEIHDLIGLWSCSTNLKLKARPKSRPRLDLP
jgi:hypothetical protein